MWILPVIISKPMKIPSKNSLESPCVRNCCLNEQDICLGCFRSIDEICNWAQADQVMRQQILQAAEQRREQMTTFKSATAINHVNSSAKQI
jgi:predicted Fe-S protein YdhL (DUF1289 family)